MEYKLISIVLRRLRGHNEIYSKYRENRYESSRNTHCTACIVINMYAARSVCLTDDGFGTRLSATRDRC